MSRASPAFTKAKVRRLVAGVIEGGARVFRMEVEPSGKITIFCGEPAVDGHDDMSDFDERLEKAIEEWGRRRTARGRSAYTTP